MGLLVNKKNASSRNRNHFAGILASAGASSSDQRRRHFDGPFDGLRLVSVVEPIKALRIPGAGGRQGDRRALERRCPTIGQPLTSWIWLDLPGFGHFKRPDPRAPQSEIRDPQSGRSRHPRPVRHEPMSHKNRLDWVECTTRQRSLNRRECTSRERIVQRGAPTAWNALRNSVERAPDSLPVSR